ncbi:MAG TPA: hypothetical protein VFZ49_05115 [Pyrinomonadaceae bacterium]
MLDGVTDKRAAFPVELGGYAKKRRPSKVRRLLLVVAGIAVFLFTVAVLGGFFYWQSLKSTPQYSLALIVDAAKKNDQATVNRLVDIDSVVDDFLPQVTSRAVELYGRGLPPQVIDRVARVAAPVMPAVKDRARDELPGAIKQKTAEFGYVPFEAMVLGADQYLEITTDQDTAIVRSLIPDQDLEVRMRREGDVWKIVAVKDDKLATTIAQRIGQEIIAIAANGSESGRSRLGVKNINELLNEAEQIFR